MAQLSYPAGDLDVGYWTNQAGQIINLYSSIAAPLNEANYVQSSDPPTDDYAKFILSGLSAPQAGTVTLRIRAKWGTATAGTTETAFIWSAVVGATSYTLELSMDGGTTWPLTYVAGNALTYYVNLSAGTYWSRVKAYQGAALINITAPEEVNVV